MVSIEYFFILSLLAGGVLTMHSSKALEGYPAGYMADCPGSTDPITITKKSLRDLSLSVQRSGNALTARRTVYNYYEMRGLAKDSEVDFNRFTLMYIGGYMDSPNFPMAPIMGNMYKDLGYNVLLLDTNKFTTMKYPMAARHIRAVGKHVAEMLVGLTQEGLDPQKLQLIGLSLGAHTMSFVAKNFQQLTGRNITRLTGLDPSGPCFRNLGPEDRLDSSDADFVDVINTNIDGFGMAAPVGHVNFYVNGGEYQPADIFTWFPCTVMCSHIRSYTLWLAALQYPDSFVAMQCNSVQQARQRDCYDRKPLVTNVLGLNTDRSKPGIFYLATQNNFPYFLGKNGLKRENDIFSTMFQ